MKSLRDAYEILKEFYEILMKSLRDAYETLEEIKEILKGCP